MFPNPLWAMFAAVLLTLGGAGGLYEYSHRAPVQQAAAPAGDRTVEQSVEDTVNQRTPFGVADQANQMLDRETTPPASDLPARDRSE